MIDSIRPFISDSLVEMDCDISVSLSLAELALRVEDEYGLRFGEEETEGLAGLTVGEFCAVVAGRAQLRTLVE